MGKRNAEAVRMGEMNDALDAFAKEMQSRGVPLSLMNEDGTTNYLNVLTLLKDPNYSQYREENPDVIRQARVNLGTERGNQLLRGAFDVATLAFSLNQISRAKKIDDTPPDFPRRPERNLSLRRAMADASRNAAQGLTDAERASLREQQARGYNKVRTDLLNTSGGQSGAAQANLQVAAAQQSRDSLRETALSEDVRRGNRARLDSLIGRELQEDANLSQFDQNRFQMREMPLWRARSAAKERLMSHGILNAYGAASNLVSDVSEIGQMFRGSTPGTIYGNDYYNSASADGQNPLDGVFNNNARFIETGGGLLQGAGQRLTDKVTWDPYNQGSRF